jgi:hypothetical protein
VTDLPPGLQICEAIIHPGKTGRAFYRIRKSIDHIEKGVENCKTYVEISVIMDKDDPAPLISATDGTAKVIIEKEVFIRKLINDIKNRQ